MATSHIYRCTETKWTYGAELELVDWPCREQLPHGMAIDENELHNVNSNGVAVDGRGKLYHLGGEILTVPSTNPEGPAEQLAQVKARWPQATVTFRTGLNIHVRVPGLRDNLSKLQRLQKFIHQVMPTVLPIIDPLPEPNTREYPHYLVLKAAKQDHLRIRKNHHTLLSPKRLALQKKARTPTEFFEAEAIHGPTGQVHWATVPRACVNLRQLLQTDTVEFRHFTGSAEPMEVSNATKWCRLFLEAALGGGSVAAAELLELGGPKAGQPWPKYLPYDHWLNTGFVFTSRKHHADEVVKAHIEEWLAKPKPQHNRRNSVCPQQ